MNINPTKSRRTVVLNIETAHTNQTDPNREASATDGETITCIHILVDDGAMVAEASFSGVAERDLLRQFWQVMQPHDVFVGRNIADRLAFLRQRSWKVGLVPSSGVDLRAMYQHSTLDIGGQQPSTGDDQYRSAGAMVYLLGLPGNHPGNKEGRVA